MQEQNSGVKAKARILIVDDHPIVRHGLKLLINQQSSMMVCGDAEDAAGALKCIELLKPDVVVLDISLKGMDGIELIKHIKAKYSKLGILVLSMHAESLYAERALRAGATGYMMKQESPEEVIKSIQRILSGKISLSEKASSQILRRVIGSCHAPHGTVAELLTDRELGVFRLFGQGYSTREIAHDLQLSIKTIESYREHIKQKLQLKTLYSTELFARNKIESKISSLRMPVGRICPGSWFGFAQGIRLILLVISLFNSASGNSGGLHDEFN